MSIVGVDAFSSLKKSHDSISRWSCHDFVRHFERRLRHYRPVEENSFFSARKQLTGNDNDQWQGVSLLKDQELPSKEVGFNVGSL